MNWSKVLVAVAAAIFIGVAYRSFGWGGVAVATGAFVMYLLLHFTRAMQVLKRAADHPIGHVGSAVMLNARLKPKSTLLHVVAMTRALGEQRSPRDEQPEVFRWTDAGGSYVDATFVQGKLSSWTLVRPPTEDEPAPVVESASAATLAPHESDAARAPASR